MPSEVTTLICQKNSCSCFKADGRTEYNICQRNAHAIATRRDSPLRGRHGHHSHVSQADAARQLPGIIPQQPSTVADRMENRHKRFQELRDHLRKSRTALHAAPISDTLRGGNQMGRHNSLFGGDPRQATHLVASHRSGQQENCSKGGPAGSPPKQEE